MQQPGPDNRHVSRKHGNTLISTLRQTLLTEFRARHAGPYRLNDVLHSLDEPSLRQLVRELHQ